MWVLYGCSKHLHGMQCVWFPDTQQRHSRQPTSLVHPQLLTAVSTVCESLVMQTEVKLQQAALRIPCSQQLLLHGC